MTRRCAARGSVRLLQALRAEGVSLRRRRRAQRGAAVSACHTTAAMPQPTDQSPTRAGEQTQLLSYSLS